MATTRKEILERKNALLSDLRFAHQRGEALPGEMAVSQRELSAKYGLSVRTISIELQKLVDEGVLYTVPRVGTFVGQPRAARDNLFLAIFAYLDKPNTQWAGVRNGFEERIAALGGTSLVVDYATAERFRGTGETAPAGVFELHYQRTEPVWMESGVPRVEFGELNHVCPGSDAVYFDNDDGGWKATRHLLGLGHRKIAFIGLHGEDEKPNFLLWSQQRQAGWRRALEAAGLSADGLSFRPPHTPETEQNVMEAATREIATRLLRRDDITAVVAANAHAAHGLFQVLRAQNRPSADWPAIVGFDNELAQSSDDAMHIVTALRLPWEEIGRQSADLLWQRAQGLDSEPQQLSVPMTLIPRLSCRQEWHRAPGLTSQNQRSVVAV